MNVGALFPLPIIGDPLGRFTLYSLPFYKMVEDPTKANLINGSIAGFAALVVLGAVIILVGLLTYFHGWRKFWTEWMTSVDPKKIGIMYIVIAFIMMMRAIIEALLMRAQQAWGLNGGFLDANHFAELFTTHGTIMILFMAMPFLTGLINYVMPMQLGSRDVAFPRLNSVSLGLTAAGAMLIMISLVFGEFSTGGWFGYPPYTELAYSPGVGVDYWIWALSLSSLGSTFSGLNFAVTIYKKRAPGMKLMHMPLFTWTALCASILMIFAMPPLTVATAQLALDRYLGFHFFTDSLGGNQMHFVNMFWMFGHPEVYIIILPSWGVFSEVIATYSGKSLYGYRSLVMATMAIAILSFTVWLHHFFTMGQSADINAVFGIMSMLIGIPTGVKIYDWVWTMVRGRVRMTTPMVYSMAFILLFVLGGMSGILLAQPSIDYQVHNTVFLIAHFHNVAVPGVLFGLLAGYHFWFPKAFGYRLHEGWGILSATCWTIGFMLAFFPLYALGMMGLPRRSSGYEQAIYQPLEMVAFGGALLIGVALLALVIQLVVSFLHRNENRVPVGDPWDGRTLEWATPSPPPAYNFPVIPVVSSRDAFTAAKEFGKGYQVPRKYVDIKMPKNSALGPAVALLGFFAAFGLVWHMWWMVVIATAVLFATLMVQGFARNTERVIPAAEVRKNHERWMDLVRVTPAIERDDERQPDNRGLAATQGPPGFAS